MLLANEQEFSRHCGDCILLRLADMFFFFVENLARGGMRSVGEVPSKELSQIMHDDIVNSLHFALRMAALLDFAKEQQFEK